MNLINEDLLHQLLRPRESAPGCLLYSQEGVFLKGNAKDDSRTFPGSLFVAKHDGSSTSANDIYVVWLPYSYTLHLAPFLLSEETMQSVAGNTGANAASSGAGTIPNAPRATTAAAMKLEWTYAFCICLGQLSRLQRKINLRGKRILILTTLGSTKSEAPLTFADGGQSAFFQAVKPFLKVIPIQGTTDEFTVEPISGERSGDASGERHVDTQQSTAEFRRDLYDKPTKKGGAKLWSQFLNVGHAVARGGTRLVHELEHLVADSPPSSPNDDTNNGSGIRPKAVAAASPSAARASIVEDKGNDDRASSVPSPHDSDYDMMEPAMEIESVVPQIKMPADAKPLGPCLNSETWRGCFDIEGRLIPKNYAQARKQAFRGGIEKQIRGEVWAFVLNVFPLDSTTSDRERLMLEYTQLYRDVKQQWQLIGPEQEKHFAAFRERRVGIDKDVARTDRTHPAFANEDSRLLKSMHNVLLTYAMFNFDVGYCQGMSDLCAVLLLIYESEAMVFIVFKQLLAERCERNFRNDEKHNMLQQLQAVETLTKGFMRPLYNHLHATQATSMTFCFRWLLVLFKREFPPGDICQLWDMILACPFTPQFEIFVCAALLRSVSGQIVDHALGYDELLKFTNTMSGKTNVRDLMVLSHDFYNFVAEQMKWRRSSAKQKSASNNHAAEASAAEDKEWPTLAEVLKEYREG